MKHGSAPVVLVVDDDAGTREAACTLLEEEGYVVALAANGRAALERLRASPCPALVLLDLRMPAMDGRALLLEVEARAELASLPIVVMTASGPGPQTIGLPYPLLRKPFGLDELMQVVTAYCPREHDVDEPATDETGLLTDSSIPPSGKQRIAQALAEADTARDGCSACEATAETRCPGCGEAFCRKCFRGRHRVPCGLRRN